MKTEPVPRRVKPGNGLCLPIPGCCRDIRESWRPFRGGIRGASLWGKRSITRANISALMGDGRLSSIQQCPIPQFKRICGSCVGRDPRDPLLFCQFSVRGAPPSFWPDSISGGSHREFPAHSTVAATFTILSACTRGVTRAQGIRSIHKTNVLSIHSRKPLPTLCSTNQLMPRSRPGSPSEL